MAFLSPHIFVITLDLQRQHFQDLTKLNCKTFKIMHFASGYPVLLNL